MWETSWDNQGYSESAKEKHEKLSLPRSQCSLLWKEIGIEKEVYVFWQAPGLFRLSLSAFTLTITHLILWRQELKSRHFELAWQGYTPCLLDESYDFRWEASGTKRCEGTWCLNSYGGRVSSRKKIVWMSNTDLENLLVVSFNLVEPRPGLWMCPDVLIHHRWMSEHPFESFAVSKIKYKGVFGTVIHWLDQGR